jgi:DNA invertase Pin-like site-specific DNA recombinase
MIGTVGTMRLSTGVFASIAEFERELIRDRVRSGLA